MLWLRLVLRVVVAGSLLVGGNKKHWKSTWTGGGFSRT